MLNENQNKKIDNMKIDYDKYKLTEGNPLSEYISLKQSEKLIEEVILINDIRDNVLAIIKMKKGEVYHINTEYFEFLYELQKDGIINMLDSWRILMDEYNLDRTFSLFTFIVYMNYYDNVKIILDKKTIGKLISDASHLVGEF